MTAEWKTGVERTRQLSSRPAKQHRYWHPPCWIILSSDVLSLWVATEIWVLFIKTKQLKHTARDGTVSTVTLTFWNFTFMSPCIVTNFFVIKPTRCTNFTNLFWHETLHVSDSSSVHHQEFIHCTLSNGICHTDSFRAGLGWSCSKAVYKPVWHIPLLSIQWINSWWWTDKLSETCRVSCQNKFVKLVHLVGFIIKKNILKLHIFRVGFD